MSNKENRIGVEKHNRRQIESLATEEMAGVMREVAASERFRGIKIDTIAHPGEEYNVRYGLAWNKDNPRKPVVRDGMLRVAVTDRLGNNRLGEFQREVGRRLAEQSLSGEKHKK